LPNPDEGDRIDGDWIVSSQSRLSFALIVNELTWKKIIKRERERQREKERKRGEKERDGSRGDKGDIAFIRRFIVAVSKGGIDSMRRLMRS